jgi:cell division protease FtsH
MVMRLPERDQVSLTRRKAYADLAVAMGGRVAEEEIFGYDKVTSGASADIKMATGLARAMATEWGMSDKLGPLLYGDAQDEVFLGRSMVQRSTHMSDETQKVVDEEIKRFVQDGYETAQKVIRENIDDLHAIAQALIEYETLTGDEIRGLLEGKTPVRPDDSEPVVKSTGVPVAGKTGRKRPEGDPGAAPEPQPGS